MFLNLGITKLGEGVGRNLDAVVSEYLRARSADQSRLNRPRQARRERGHPLRLEEALRRHGASPSSGACATLPSVCERRRPTAPQRTAESQLLAPPSQPRASRSFPSRSSPPPPAGWAQE